MKKERKKGLGSIFKQQTRRQVKTMKYLGIITDNNRKMQENICLIEISETKLGTYL